jgi:hypothetical protein
MTHIAFFGGRRGTGVVRALYSWTFRYTFGIDNVRCQFRTIVVPRMDPGLTIRLLV